MNDDASYKALTERLQQLQQEKSEAKGAYAETLRRLRTELNIASLSDAIADKKRLGLKVARLEKESAEEIARLTEELNQREE